MRLDKQEAFKLRSEGKSYKEISRLLNIPLSTLSGWLSKDLKSQILKEELSLKQREASRQNIIVYHEKRAEILGNYYTQTRKDAIEEYKKHKHNNLFISGLSLYWGEGDKTSPYNIRIVNIDPGILSIFRHFLVSICNIPTDKIRAWILLYPDLNEEDCKRFWIENIIGLTRDSFTKSIYIRGKSSTKRVKYGICTLGISNKALKMKINLWIDLLKSDINR